MKQRVKPGARGSLESGGAETGGTKKQVKRRSVNETENRKK